MTRRLRASWLLDGTGAPPVADALVVWDDEGRIRYAGTAAADLDDQDFTEKLEGLYEEFTRLSDAGDALRAKVDAAINGILST